MKLPPLPRKRYFGSSTEPKFVEERRSQLEEYLKSIVAIPHVWIRSDLPRFLDNESNSMIFIWNFERVKRMQEVSYDIMCSKILEMTDNDIFIIDCEHHVNRKQE